MYLFDLNRSKLIERSKNFTSDKMGRTLTPKKKKEKERTHFDYFTQNDMSFTCEPKLSPSLLLKFCSTTSETTSFQTSLRDKQRWTLPGNGGDTIKAETKSIICNGAKPNPVAANGNQNDTPQPTNLHIHYHPIFLPPPSPSPPPPLQRLSSSSPSLSSSASLLLLSVRFFCS